MAKLCEDAAWRRPPQGRRAMGAEFSQTVCWCPALWVTLAAAVALVIVATEVTVGCMTPGWG